MSTHYQGSENEVLALDTFIKFTRASNTIETNLFQQDIIEDLTPSQFGVLETLFHLGPLCQTELSTKLLKSTSNMTLVLDNLEKRDLVRREREKQDRRMITISLTTAGEEMIKRIFPQVVQKILKDFSVLTTEEQQNLGVICRKLGKQNLLVK
jgi:MarR family transcriptional regulator, 2-MHQ and catechol-resistance regulon repressor